MLQPTCGACGSIDTQAGLDSFQCLTCGRITTHEGRLVPETPEFLVSQEDGPWRNNPED